MDQFEEFIETAVKPYTLALSFMPISLTPLQRAC
jgi:hypothetical protein